MLWSLVTPMLLSSLILAFAAGVALVVASRRGWNRRRMLRWMVPAAAIGWIPLVIVMLVILNGLRFGRFDFEAVSDVQEQRLTRYLPPMAVQITIEATAQGHRARFAISESALRSFVDGLWDAGAAASPVRRGDLVATPFNEVFGDLGWALSSQTVVFPGPMTGNGAGAVYYYDRLSGLGYLDAAYW